MSRDLVAELRDRTGLDVAGVFAFGDTPQLQDELLDAVRCGTKRATAASVTAAEEEREAAPEVGRCWGVLDGHGEPACVIQTVEVTRGRLGEVTPAFAWDEGEDDRTVESWLDAHRAFFARIGEGGHDDLPVFFERFRVLWPEEDTVDWLTDGVRELRWDERAWWRQTYLERHGTALVVSRGVEHDVTNLPALVCEHDGERVGVLTFRPRPGGDTECVTVDALLPDADVRRRLAEAIAELARRSGWRRVWQGMPSRRLA